MRRTDNAHATTPGPRAALLSVSVSVAVAVATAALLLAGCTGSPEGSEDSGGSAGTMSAEAGDSARASGGGADVPAAVDGLQSSTGNRQAAERRAVREPAIIATGSVALTAKDVGDARADAQLVAERHGGHVTDAQTSTDEDGEVRSAHLVLRVPSDAFAEAMADVERIGTLRESSTTSEDVTQQVVDTDARVATERASIDRIRLLLSRAEKLGDVISIESELARREADLESLLQQQAYLADQTSLSTITVTVERSGPRSTSDDAGFLAGLGAGWDALAGFAAALATAAGAVLPWVPVIALVGVPIWLLTRRRRTRLAPDLADGDAPAAG
ncbi:MAG TPA: DUF4349 domain-containing protein [Nocardioides sp.]|uniref:DUF4349 domain-containing protein n=1 Tax=Nocardioides sp. TaxID=35761 RepID=UPI002EDA6F85